MSFSPLQRVAVVALTAFILLPLHAHLNADLATFRHTAAACALEHQHGATTPNCTQYGERYGPSFNWVNSMDKIEGVRQSMSLEAVSIVVVAGIIGGFRDFAADLLWLKSDEYWHKGKADRMVPILEVVTILDPHFIEGWKIAGWNWAYNRMVEVVARKDKDECIQKGLDFLKRGIAFNPTRSELYFELGWTLFDKVGDHEQAVKWFRAARGDVGEEVRDRSLAKQIAEDYRKNFKLNLATREMGHSYERIPDFEKALEAYNDLLQLTPVQREALDKWVAWKKTYRPMRLLVRSYNKLSMTPTPQSLPPGPEGEERTLPPMPVERPKPYHFLECAHLKRKYMSSEEVRKVRPDIQKYAGFDEFDRVVDTYIHAVERKDTATQNWLRGEFPHIAEAAQLAPTIRKVELKDNVGAGATITIRIRYMEGWKWLKQGRALKNSDPAKARGCFEKAREEMFKAMNLEPEEASFPFGHHLLARIYEEMAELNKASTECPVCRSEPATVGTTGKIDGDWKAHPEWQRHSLDRHKAYFEGWVESAQHNQMNRIAHAKVLQYQTLYNMPRVDVKKPREETAPPDIRPQPIERRPRTGN